MSSPDAQPVDLNAAGAASTDRNPAPAPLQVEISAQKDSTLVEAVRVIEQRIEKRTAQLKLLEKLLDALPDNDEGDDDLNTSTPRVSWVASEMEGFDDVNRGQKGDDDRQRLSRTACVNFTHDLASNDLFLTKADAKQLAKEFMYQLAWLREYLDKMLKTPLSDAHKNLKSRK